MGAAVGAAYVFVPPEEVGAASYLAPCGSPAGSPTSEVQYRQSVSSHLVNYVFIYIHIHCICGCRCTAFEGGRRGGEVVCTRLIARWSGPRQDVLLCYDIGLGCGVYGEAEYMSPCLYIRRKVEALSPCQKAACGDACHERQRQRLMVMPHALIASTAVRRAVVRAHLSLNVRVCEGGRRRCAVAVPRWCWWY